MKVNVLLFSAHRERAGTNRLEVDLPKGASVGDLFHELVQRYPTLAPTEPFTTYARNHEVVQPTEILTDGDEVALLLPVSGG